MSELIACPSCRRPLRIKPKHRGLRLRCKRCEQGYYVPRHDRIDCIGCSAELRISPETLGTLVECKRCQTVFRAPENGRVRVEPISVARADRREPVGVITCDHVAEPAREDVESWAELERARVETTLAHSEIERARAETDLLRIELAEAERARDESARLQAALVGEASAERDKLKVTIEEQAALRLDLEARLDEATRSLKALLDSAGQREADMADRIELAETSLRDAEAERDDLVHALRDLTTQLAVQSRTARETHARWAADRRHWRIQAERFVADLAVDRQALAERIAQADATKSDALVALSDRLERAEAERLDTESTLIELRARLDFAQAEHTAQAEQFQAAFQGAERRATEAAHEREELAARLATMQAEANRLVAEAVAERDAVQTEFHKLRAVARRRITDLMAEVKSLQQASPARPDEGRSPAPAAPPVPAAAVPSSTIDLALEDWADDRPFRLQSLSRTAQSVKKEKARE